MSRTASKSAAKAAPPEYPEFAVRRDGFNRYFDKPLPTSTFHDKVNEGIIIPLKGLKGFYKLNDSLARLGLRPVMTLPEPEPTRTSDDLIRLAFSLIDPAWFPEPAWLLGAEAIEARDLDLVLRAAEQHRAAVEALATPQEKLAYLAGVLDFEEMNAMRLAGELDVG